MTQNKLVSIFIGLIWSTSLFAQQVQSVVLLSDAPDTTGFLMVEANTFHTSADCPMVDSFSGVTIINDTITIKAVYNLGQMILSKKLIKQ